MTTEDIFKIRPYAGGRQKRWGLSLRMPGIYERMYT